LNFKNREIKKLKNYTSSGIRTRNTWVLRPQNTCAILCAKKTAENVFNINEIVKGKLLSTLNEKEHNYEIF